jgi:hypothetical protein
MRRASVSAVEQLLFEDGDDDLERKLAALR